MTACMFEWGEAECSPDWAHAKLTDTAFTSSPAQLTAPMQYLPAKWSSKHSAVTAKSSSDRS